MLHISRQNILDSLNLDLPLFDFQLGRIGHCTARHYFLFENYPHVHQVEQILSSTKISAVVNMVNLVKNRHEADY